MSRPITKEELLALISEGLADVENAIARHSAMAASSYDNGKRALLAEGITSTVPAWARGSTLSPPELSLILQYLFATAFMSAWYHVQGDKTRRDQAASPACLLVSGLGFTPDDVLSCFIDYERAWRASMKNGSALHVKSSTKASSESMKNRAFGLLKVGGTVIIVLFLLGFRIGSKVFPPSHAHVYVDDYMKTYFAPPCVMGREAGFRRSTIGEVQKAQFGPDPNCREQGAFRQAGRSLSGQFLQKIGFLPKLNSRWNPDGSWNW